MKKSPYAPEQVGIEPTQSSESRGLKGDSTSPTEVIVPRPPALCSVLGSRRISAEALTCRWDRAFSCIQTAQ